MRVRIHHGAHEIGGNCVEVEHDGARLVLDVGRPLTAGKGEDVPLPDIAGLADDGEDQVLGVLISHYHQDHWGLIDQVRAGMPIYMGAATERILRAAAFWTRGLDVPIAGHLEHRVPSELGPFTITPYLNDHSAFDAYSLLVEAGGESLFYTGDIRGHGRKAGIFEQLLDDPPANVDTLLMEGTNIQPGMPAKPVLTESAVEKAMAATFRATDGMALVITSAQNIDRLVTIYRAAKQTGRKLVMDPYSADIARATRRETIPRPHPDWPNIHTYMPFWQSVRVKENEAFHLLDGEDGINPYRLFPEDLAADPSQYVLLFSAADGPKLAKAGALEGATCTYSLWSGYLDEPSGVKLRSFRDKHKIPLTQHHTSGHASVEDLARLAEAIDPAQVVPIHTFGGASFDAITPVAVQKPDGEWWDARPLFTPAVQERPGYDVLMYVPVYEGPPRTILGAVVWDGASPAWVDGWRDEGDPKDAAAAWEYYEEGYGVSQTRGVLSLRLASVDEAPAALEQLQAMLEQPADDDAALATPSVEPPDPTGSDEGHEPDSTTVDEAELPAITPLEIHRLEAGQLLSLHDVHPSGLEHNHGLGLPWSVAIPQVQHIIAGPDAHHWFPQPPRRGDVDAGAAYYAPLLHTLLFRLGWVRPDRGVYQWDGAGYPDDEPHLRLVRHLWGAEVALAPFFIWLGDSKFIVAQLHELHGLDDDGEPVPIDREWADSVRAAQAAEGGFFAPTLGWDSLHLSNVVSAALDPQTDGEPAIFTGEFEKREGVLVLDTMRGWYRALHTFETLLELEETSDEHDAPWAWEVLVRGVGSLGTYRMSPETGIRHATTERVHRWGTWPIDQDTVVLRF